MSISDIKKKKHKTTAQKCTRKNAVTPQHSARGRRNTFLRMFMTVFVAALAVTLLLLSGGCAEDNKPGTGIFSSTQEQQATAENLFTGNNQAPADAPLEPLSRWLPDDTFNSLIWGEYILDCPSYTQVLGFATINQEGIADFLSNMEFEKMTLENHEEHEVSALPVRIKSGPRNVNHRFEANLAKHGYSLINYHVYSTNDQDTVYVSKPYKVEGNRIIIYPEWTHEYIDLDVNDDDYSGNYDAIVTVNTENTIDIDFYFEGRDLILTRNGLSIKMIPALFANEEPWVMITHYAEGGQGYGEIVYIEYSAVPPRSDGSRRLLDGMTRINFSDSRFSEINNPIDPVLELFSNGLMRIRWEEIKREMVALPSEPGSWLIVWDEESGRESNPTVLWFRYIFCDSDGLILIDGEGQHYLYQLHYRDHDDAKLADSLGDGVDFEDLSDYEVNQLVEVHSNILEDLQAAFTEAGINADIDNMTGKVTLDTSFLFDVNDYTLSDEGMAYFDRFLDVYASVVMSDTYARSIAEILVEGHTDSDGSHEHNQTLSENRAAAVAEYCLSRQPQLAEIMVTRGMAFDQPVLDADGNEDKAASRRVVFKFILST